jgi:hypothetical protein
MDRRFKFRMAGWCNEGDEPLHIDIAVSGFVAIITALIGVILNHWEALKISQGPQQDYVLFVHNLIYWIRTGFYFASFLFSLSLRSVTSLVVDFKRFKRRYLCLCIIGLVLTLCVYVYLMMFRNRFF